MWPWAYVSGNTVVLQAQKAKIVASRVECPILDSSAMYALYLTRLAFGGKEVFIFVLQMLWKRNVVGMEKILAFQWSAQNQIRAPKTRSAIGCFPRSDITNSYYILKVSQKQISEGCGPKEVEPRWGIQRIQPLFGRTLCCHIFAEILPLT